MNRVRPTAVLLVAPLAVLLVAALVVLLAGAVHAAPASVRPGTEGIDLESEAERLAEETAAPGVSVAIVDSTGVVDTASAGVDGDGQPVDSDSRFVWGSVSKSFAALVMSELGQQGRVDLAAPVADVLPELAGSELDATGVTLSDLVHHTSGLSHVMSLADDWERTGPATGVVPEIAAMTGLGPRGEYLYSSINYILIQAIVETVTQRPYGEVLDDILGETTGVTGVVTDREEFDRSIPPGTVPFFFGQRPIDVGMDSAGLGYGYLSGTLDQLARYASWQLADLRSDSPESVARREGAVEMGQGGPGGPTRYGNGLILEERAVDSGTVGIARHSGAVPGYFTYLAVSPDRDRGVVVSANSYGELTAANSAGAAEAFADRAMGLDAESVPGRTLYIGVVVGVGIVALALLVTLLLVVVSLLRTRSPERSVRSTVVRVLISGIVGAGLLVGGLIGVPALVGVPFDVAYLWAPDVTLLAWVTLGLVFLITAVVIVREIAWNRRFAGVWRET